MALRQHAQCEVGPQGNAGWSDKEFFHAIMCFLLTMPACANRQADCGKPGKNLMVTQEPVSTTSAKSHTASSMCSPGVGPSTLIVKSVGALSLLHARWRLSVVLRGQSTNVPFQSAERLLAKMCLSGCPAGPTLVAEPSACGSCMRCHDHSSPAQCHKERLAQRHRDAWAWIGLHADACHGNLLKAELNETRAWMLPRNRPQEFISIFLLGINTQTPSSCNLPDVQLGRTTR